MAEPTDNPRPEETPRGGRCAIVGRPNVGKSTLLNAILGQKLVIATERPGTTRSNVLGVYASNDPPTQIAFVDTPGIGRPRSALHRALVEEAQESLTNTDVVVLLSDRHGVKDGEPHPADLQVLDIVRQAGVPVILALNKVDLVKKKDYLLPVLVAWESAYDFAAIVPVSAASGTNLKALVGEIRAQLPGGLLYPEDFLTDRPERFFAAELIREAVLRHTREEVPYGVAVLIEKFEDDAGLSRIHATIVVEKASHKKIVIGSRGSLIKTIGTEARKEIEGLLERRVYLELWVKVVEGWTHSDRHVRELTRGES